MNAPVNAVFASIFSKYCAPAHQQPMVNGEYLSTVDYDGLLLDVYADSEGGYGGITLAGSKVFLCGLMSDEVIDEIQRKAEEKLAAA